MVLSLEQQDAVWERWRAGEPVRVIGLFAVRGE